MVEVNTGNVSIIPAHSTPLRALELSPNGEVLATASETGTLIRIFSTSNCTRTGELRRGVDHAEIFSISISPSSTLLAVTSDKATLHIFNLPHTSSHSRNSSANSNRPHRHSNSFAANGSRDANVNQKWGILGKVPLMPRVFSDIYSFTSAHIEIEDNPQSNIKGTNFTPIPGIPGGKPKKGIIGWKDEYTILVVGAGRDGRWEKFILGESEDGRRILVRSGWKRYLGN